MQRLSNALSLRLQAPLIYQMPEPAVHPLVDRIRRALARWRDNSGGVL